MKFFVTAIGTDSGKTVVSALLCEILNAEYWKPVQAGLAETDSGSLRSLSREDLLIHPERYRLKEPMSPHAAAAIDGVSIDISDFELPNTESNLIVEGAGGLMVPINDEHCIIDLIDRLGLPVILVSNQYLGSINHTLLSVEALVKRNIDIAGIIYNGERNLQSESAIEKMTGLKTLFALPTIEGLGPDKIKELGASCKDEFYDNIGKR